MHERKSFGLPYDRKKKTFHTKNFYYNKPLKKRNPFLPGFLLPNFQTLLTTGVNYWHQYTKSQVKELSVDIVKNFADVFLNWI